MTPAFYCSSDGRRPDDYGGEGSLPGFERELRDTRVLVIEDDAVIAWTMESLLADLGFSAIEVAPTGAKAIELAQAQAPGLIFSDINLGAGIDGIDAVSAIVPAAGAHVIFVTGYATDTVRERIDRILPGAVVLRKPIRSADLRSAVIAALTARRKH